MKFIILAAVLIGSLTAAPYVDTKSILAQMDQEQFGNAMISLVSLNMASENSADEILLTLDKIITQLEADQRSLDQKNATDQAYCDSTLSTLSSQISDTENSIITLQRAIEDNTELLTSAQSDLALAVSDYDETVKSIQVNADEREEQHEKFAASDAELTDTIIAVDETTKLIQHMIHGVAFAQIKTRFEKVMEKLSTNKSKQSHLFKPLVLSLSQLASKLNYEDVSRILELLANIRASLVDNQESDRSSENKAQKDWENLDSELNSQKVSLSEKKSRLTNLITNTQQILTQLVKSFEERKVEYENATASLNETSQWCERTERFYEQDTEEREYELGVLEQLSEHIESKFGAVSDFVQMRKY